MIFLIFSYGDHLIQQSRTSKFSRGHYEKHFCEINLNLDQCFRSRCLKIFLIYRSGTFFVQRRETMSSIFVESIL